MIAFASVDLPDPLGPISAWISPFDTSRSSPLRISLSSALTCRFLISRSAICLRCLGLSGEWALCGLAGHRLPGRMLLGELHQLRQGGSGERLGDAAVDAGPQKLGGTSPIAVGLVRAQHAALTHLVEALHRGDRALERLNDVEHLDLRSGPRQ